MSTAIVGVIDNCAICRLLPLGILLSLAQIVHLVTQVENLRPFSPQILLSLAQIAHLVTQVENHTRLIRNRENCFDRQLAVTVRFG